MQFLISIKILMSLSDINNDSMINHVQMDLIFILN